jgi:poly(hydroxyalkanoate) granule-associated protein
MLRDSVEQVWLAGLGALALTEEEGLRFFRRLVRRGEGFERDARARLDDAVGRARAVPGAAMDRIEARLDGTMTGALHRLGVPTTRELDSLKRRIDALAESVQRRGAARRAPAAGRKAPARAATTSKRTTARRAPARAASRPAPA